MREGGVGSMFGSRIVELAAFLRYLHSSRFAVFETDGASSLARTIICCIKETRLTHERVRFGPILKPNLVESSRHNIVD